MGLIIPIILLISSLGIFFGYVDPNYKGSSYTPGDYSTYSVSALQGELGNFQQIETSSQQVKDKRDSLIAQKNSISVDDQDKLAVMLPSNIDNIRLIIEINNIASQKGISIKNISFSEQGANQNAISTQAYGTLNLKFTVTTTYGNFLNFLSDLESNLRLIDVTGISFSSTNSGLYDFNVSINTYWLK